MKCTITVPYRIFHSPPIPLLHLFSPPSLPPSPRHPPAFWCHSTLSCLQHMFFIVIFWFCFIVFLLLKCGYDKVMRLVAILEGPFAEFLVTYLYLILLVPIKHRNKNWQAGKYSNCWIPLFPANCTFSTSYIQAGKFKVNTGKWKAQASRFLCSPGLRWPCVSGTPLNSKQPQTRPAGWRPNSVTPVLQPGLSWWLSFCIWQVTALKPSFLVT